MRAQDRTFLGKFDCDLMWFLTSLICGASLSVGAGYAEVRTFAVTLLLEDEAMQSYANFGFRREGPHEIRRKPSFSGEVMDFTVASCDQYGPRGNSKFLPNWHEAYKKPSFFRWGVSFSGVQHADLGLRARGWGKTQTERPIKHLEEV